MIIQKNWATGCYEVSETVNGLPVFKVYDGYTKDEVVKDFEEYIRYSIDPGYKPSVTDLTFNS